MIEKLLALLRGEIMLLKQAFSKDIKSLSGLIESGFEAIKEQKPPVVNVEAPIVNVEPPKVEVNVPDIIIPEIKFPKIEIPQIASPIIPEIKIPEIIIPEIKLPKIYIPEIKIPEIKVSTKEVAEAVAKEIRKLEAILKSAVKSGTQTGITDKVPENYYEQILYVLRRLRAHEVVGVKNTAETRVNPATEEKQDDTIATLEALLTELEAKTEPGDVQSVSGTVEISNDAGNPIPVQGTVTVEGVTTSNGILKKTVSLAASGAVHSTTAGKKLRIFALKFSLSADMTDVAFKFASGSAFEKYLAPKTGGLYGANNHPDYIEGNTAEALNCDITGTGTVQINLDYLEV